MNCPKCGATYSIQAGQKICLACGHLGGPA
jgi:hypothetical protein